jgi:aquaporin Z
MGLAMGLTAVALIYSYPGKRSGAHMNPAVTLSALRLKRISARDAAGYIAAQLVGGALGVALVALVASRWLSHPNVNYVVTAPGSSIALAWIAEVAIAFFMMGMSLAANRVPRLAPYTGVFAGVLVWAYITFEAPISGMSLNPARTIASALSANSWMAIWIYLTAPCVGMLAAVEAGRLISSAPTQLCCKVNHSSKTPCHCKCDCLAETESARAIDGAIKQLTA